MVAGYLCLVGIVLAGFYDNGLAETSVISISNACGFREKECTHEAAQQEEDDASLMQVQLSMNEEHQLGEATSDTVRKDLLNNDQQEFGKVQEDHNQRMGTHEAPSERHQLSLLRTVIATRLEQVGDTDLIVLGVIFVCIFVIGCILTICINGLHKNDQQRAGSEKFIALKGSPTFDSRSIQGSPKPPASGRGSSASMQPRQGGYADQGSYMQGESPFSTGGSLPQGSVMQGGMPLCPGLVVPDGTRLACMVKNGVCRKKQTLNFDVCSLLERGHTALFKVTVSELNPGQKRGIYLQSLEGSETLAYLSTEELWSMPGGADRTDIHPALSIYRSSVGGALFGTVQKEPGGYVVMRGKTVLMTWSGNFQHRDVKAISANGRVIALTAPLAGDEYQVVVQSRVDAGLVLLSLLATDKLERIPE